MCTCVCLCKSRRDKIAMDWCPSALSPHKVHAVSKLLKSLVDQEHLATSTQQIGYKTKTHEPVVHLGIPLNIPQIWIPQMNPLEDQFSPRTAMYLSHSITVSTMTRYPNERPLDSSIHDQSMSIICSVQSSTSETRSGLNFLVSHTTLGLTSTRPTVSRTGF